MMKHDLSYLAGLFDGEGTFSIQVDRRQSNKRSNIKVNPRMSMSIKYGTDVLDDLQKEFGGQIYNYSDGTKRWNLSKKDLVLTAAIKLYPLLRIKKETAKKFIEAVKLIPNSKNMDKLNGKRVLNKDNCLRIAEIAFTLNNISDSKKQKNLNTLEIIRRVYEDT